jgi:hypothetical protein
MGWQVRLRGGQHVGEVTFDGDAGRLSGRARVDHHPLDQAPGGLECLAVGRGPGQPVAQLRQRAAIRLAQVW